MEGQRADELGADAGVLDDFRTILDGKANTVGRIGAKRHFLHGALLEEVAAPVGDRLRQVAAPVRHRLRQVAARVRGRRVRSERQRREQHEQQREEDACHRCRRRRCSSDAAASQATDGRGE